MRIASIVPLILVGLALASCSQDAEVEKESVKKGPQEVVAEVVLPEVSDFRQQATATGTFVAEDQVQISSETSGYLQEIFFREGAYKKKGELLAKINDAELRAQKRKLGVELDYARIELRRAEELGELQAIATEEVDRLRNAVQLIEADIAIVDAQLAKTEVYAPFSGRIGLKLLSEGAYLSPGMGMAELLRLDPIKLEFFVPEKNAGSVGVGDMVSFNIPASKDTFRAKIYLVSPTLDENNRSLRMRCRVANPRAVFFPGGYAEVRYDLKRQETALEVPAEAIIPVLNGQKVLVVENGKVVSRPVEVGMRSPSFVQILSGLSAQDSVMVTGILGATDGMSVRAKIKEAR